MRDLEASLARMKSRWLAGGAVTAEAPENWRKGAGDQLVLAALAGHALAVLFEPQPATELTQAKPLPDLALPFLPENLRTLFRRVQSNAKNDVEPVLHAVFLAAGRGFAVHPADWMPHSAAAEIPAIYSPWLSWLESGDARAVDEVPSADDWPHWSWTDRRRAFARLRRHEPEAALSLLAAIFATEPAEKRLTLLETLQIKLAPGDIPFLESISSDRSERVRYQAANLLARLGWATVAGALEIELAGFLDIGQTGILRKQLTIAPQKLKTGAQLTRLRELFGVVTLSGLAQHAGITSDAFVNAWVFEKAAQFDLQFSRLIAATGTLPQCESLLSRLSDPHDAGTEALAILAARLEGEARRELIRSLIQIDKVRDFSFSASLCMSDAGWLDWPTLSGSKSFRALVESCKATETDYRLGLAFTALGKLCRPDAARKVIEACTASSLSSADPRFDLLQFNAAFEGMPSS